MSEDWQAELMDALEAYSDEVTEEVKKAVLETADSTVALLKQTSPVKAHGKKRGKYRRGWRAKMIYDGGTDRRMVVYNATDYQLTHLLEYGHANRDGSFTAARPHIAAAEEKAKKELEDKIRVTVRR